MEKEEIEAIMDAKLKPLFDEIEEIKQFLTDKLDYHVIHFSGEQIERIQRLSQTGALRRQELKELLMSYERELTRQQLK